MVMRVWCFHNGNVAATDNKGAQVPHWQKPLATTSMPIPEAFEQLLWQMIEERAIMDSAYIQTVWPVYGRYEFTVPEGSNA